MTDKEVILKIKKGEVNYFEIIFQKYFLVVTKFISERVFEKQDVDDIVQEAFFKFYRSINRFDENKKILPYLFEIAKNEVKMYYRSKKPSYSLTDKLILKLSFLTQKEDSLSSIEVDDYLKKLNEKEKKIFLMLIDGYSYIDISKKTKKPLNTIKSIIRRLRQKLTVNK
ncbi:MAG: sigma-70 family RNA polymerase sigma factor [Candidatus Microgenomates bacterium]